MTAEFENSPTRIARPYTLVGGRTRSTGATLGVESLVWSVGADPARALDEAVPARIVAVCAEGGRSIADLAALLEMPIGVTRVLVGDLIAQGLLEAGNQLPAPAEGGAQQDRDLLKRVLSNVERL